MEVLWKEEAEEAPGGRALAREPDLEWRLQNGYVPREKTSQVQPNPDKA